MVSRFFSVLQSAAILATIVMPAAFAFTATSAQASTLWRNCPESAWQEAESVLAEVRSNRDRGIFSGFDVIRFEILALDAGFCAGKIAKQEFCSRKARVLADYETVIRKMQAMDLSAIDARENLVRWTAEHATVCAN